MFAGPNGSGKSTVKDYLLPQHIGAYLNADELEQNLRQSQRIDLLHYHPSLKASELVTFLKSKKRPQTGQFVALLAHEPIVLDEWKIEFKTNEIDSYLCARIIDYIRLEFLRLKVSFTFETVMSHISKVEFLREAKRQGYKTYLYYVSVGGHPVPEQKIIERYYRSMDLLMQAVECCDRAYLFDNSSDGIQASFLAEIEAAETLKMNAAVSKLPRWFAERVLSEFQ
jgi:predicted ABC-type ATPase